MKRIIAGLLAVVLLVILSVAPAMAEEGTTGTAVPQETEGVLETSVVQNAAEPSYLEFDQIRDVLRHNNYNVKAMEASIRDLSNQDSGDLWDAIRQLENLKTQVKKMLGEVENALKQISSIPPVSGGEGSGETDSGEGGTQEDPTAMTELILGGLQMSLSVDVANLESQISSLESQMDTIDSTIESTENTLNNAINQIVKGVETLYIGVVTMESSLDAIQRGIDTMDRTIAIYEKQYELGMVSQYEVEAMNYQRSTLASQLEALRFQIETSKITLEGMCGLELRGTIQLGELPMPTEEELADVSYEKYLEKATKQNVDVQNAKVDEEYDSSTANENAVTAAEQTFAYNFKVLCMTVAEKDRLVGVAEEALAFQERTFEITAKQYELGMISQEEYRAGESDLLTAQESVNSAQLELFTAYRNYIWARDYGLI